MTVQLNWPSDILDRVTKEAREKGLPLDTYLLQAVLNQGAAHGTIPSGETTQQQARQQAGRSIRELRKGNILGPDISIRDLIEEGRRF